MPLTVNSTCVTCGFGIVDATGALYQAARSCPQCANTYYHNACLTGPAVCGHQLVDAAPEAATLAATIAHQPVAAQPAAQQAVVPTTTDSLDTRNDLGGFDRRFTWNCPATATGYIVQQIVRVERVLDAADAEIADLTHRDTYWEAWPVAGGVVMFPDGVTPMNGASHDAWCRDVNRDQRAGRHGDWSITGTVHWLDAGTQQLAGFVENGVDSASGLLATRTDPGLTGAPVLVHSRQGTWDGRTAQAVLAVLNADSAGGVMTASSREDAIEELKENGFPTDTATEGVDLYLAAGGRFNED